ncbi:MAG: MBL fold metallo-hydrolase [bacterium]
MSFLKLLDLKQDLLGQERFIGCWLRRQNDETFIVDPGPEASAADLLGQLKAAGVEDLDYILLTHIHLDHAGGTASICAAYPGARVVCHSGAVPHLVDPTRLWEGSVNVLGEMAARYEKPGAVPEDSFATTSEVAAVGIRVLQTPGHAAHHCCYLHGDTLFAGEAAGTFLSLGDGRFYLRPATPPAFFFDQAKLSLTTLLNLEPEPFRLAFGHHGASEGNVHELLKVARDQLERWMKVAREEGGRGAPTFDELLQQTRRRLQIEDPYFAPLADLEADAREREKTFTAQSLRGMFGYIDAEIYGARSHQARVSGDGGD